jgi:hypothetical protein
MTFDYGEYKKKFHNDLILFNEPNTIQYTNGKDKGIVQPIGTKGNDPISCDATLLVDYNTVNVEYRFNSLGLRGPEPDPNAEFRILFLGGSLVFGTGLNVESTFAHMLASKYNASYINLSPCNFLLELFEPTVKYVKEFNPNVLVFSDVRGFQEAEWFVDHIYKAVLEKNEDLGKSYREGIIQSRKQISRMFFYSLRLLTDNVIILRTPRYFWRSLSSETHFANYPEIVLDKEYYIDLARDCNHPGQMSHQKIADSVSEVIDTLLY